MSLIKFIDNIELSNEEITEKIIKTEDELFQLIFKKATRQAFKSHEIKSFKRLIAQLKTRLTQRLRDENLADLILRTRLISEEN